MTTATTTAGTASLLGATLATAMVAGLLFSFAHSVMPGLGTLDDRGFLTSFQRIDAAISNPWMMLTFLGSPVLTLAALLLHLPGRSPAVPWLVVALVLVVATVVITGAIHLPLNAAVQDAAPDLVDSAGLRARFEERWIRWNVLRTVTSTGSLACLAWALFVAGRAAG
ncbi:anthrone oxygenase family protein [Nocardioides sp. AX2bis]|uniref:anthrone oxygenase family protein n=1 Tax=Nocardioides sp. AX2bis TaxID=2653157 RepID=UPI0012F3CFCE|nr:anthrone oxygenase family protein [Nocardioides sp. AX2bis]VXB16105.1 Putative membrane protein [Nocardioides sp. AX2bis]